MLSLKVDFGFGVLRSDTLRLLSPVSNRLTRSETLRHAGEDFLSSIWSTVSSGFNNSTRSETLLQAGDFIKLRPELSTKVPDPVKPLKHVSL